MAIRPIIYLGDERLTTASTPVTDFGSEFQPLIDDAFETMYFEHGVGLAAPQLGMNFQWTVIDVTEDKSKQWCLVNPKIVSRSKVEVWMTEGCLSIPGAYAEVLRAEKIKVKAQDRFGNSFEIAAEGLLARCILHECDHLEGKLFIDYLSEPKRQRAIEQYEQWQHNQG
jgi:peptide deformylase